MREYFEKNPESQLYLDRLIDEWRQYGKIIVGIDFDDTISPWKLTDFDFSRILKLLKIVKQTGAYLVIFTACREDRYDEINEYCKNAGLEIDSINETPINIPYGHDKKIYANIFLDDRAGLNEAIHILEFATYIIRGEQHSPKIDVN